MIIETKQERAVIVGAEIKNFGVHLDPSVYIQMLTKWYSDVEGSVVRELLSNAIDATIESGSETYPVVGIEGNRVFVQDFGTGMSPDFMNNNIEQEYETEFGTTKAKVGYLTIGHSTKKESTEQHGYFGVGRISPLAYTNQYWVNTVYQGIAYQYLIFLDGNTIKQTLLDYKSTDEPSGTRVVVQIKEEWGAKEEWKNAIKKQAAYFDKVCIGEGISHATKVEVQTDEEGIKSSNLWSNETHLVFGCVNYDIPWKSFPEWEFIKLMRWGIPIGLDEGLVPTPSRESFQVTEQSKQLVISKFKQICESVYNKCNQILEDVKGKSDIVKLKFYYEDKVGTINYKTYLDICKALGKTSVEYLDDFYVEGYRRTFYRTIKDSFNYSDKAPYYFLTSVSSLKKQYLKDTKGTVGYVTLGNKSFSLKWSLKIDTSKIPDGQRSLYIEQQSNLVAKRLQQEYIDEFFLKFDEQDYENWKKDRKVKRKVEKKKGITFYRAHINNSNLCVEDKADLDFSPNYVFKATKQTAQKYWCFLTKLNLKSMIITKSEGYDLDILEPSPMLRRLCSEALKTKVYNILGDDLKQANVLNLIKNLNPLVYQYIEETNLTRSLKIPTTAIDVIDGLIEAGNLLGCFNKDEVKLRYIEYHLNKMKLIKYLGNMYYTDKNFTREQEQLIRRNYTLERLVEKKNLMIDTMETIDQNQLTLQLN